jgi:glutamine amidotransferase
MLAVVNLGIGNVGSIPNALRKMGVEAALVDDAAGVLAADRIILPGVGAFDAGMDAIERLGLADALRRQVLERGVPLLGICLGMQMLAEGSEEGVRPGLGWIPGRVVRFRFPAPSPDLRIPHMGWNTVMPSEGSRLLAPGAEHRYYFVHSYHFECADAADVAGTTSYGRSFPSVVERGHIAGVQFHPEKSHRQGLSLLERFARGG